jgi:lipid-A-disaccharide synthase
MLERLAEYDRLIFYAINHDWSDPGLDVLFAFFTYLGHSAALAPLGLLCLYAFDRKNFPKNFLVMGAVLLFGGLWVQLVKAFIDRPRPFADPLLGADTAAAIKTSLFGLVDEWNVPLAPRLPALAYCSGALHLIGPRLARHSYPSGHAAAAFGAATALTYAYRRWFWLFFLPAAAVAVSRVYVGAHFPLDVVIGALIGVVNAWALLDWLRPYTGIGLRRPRTFAPAASPPGQPLIMLTAGEASADAYAARLVAAFKGTTPGARFIGVGGEQTIAAGLEPLGRADELAIVGFTGVLTGLRGLRRVYRALLGAMDRRRPDALVCLDLPDFNLGLANQAKGRGIPVLYYISPQVWAWRPGRIATIADRIDRMVVTLPFEKPLYEKEHVPVDFFGHPILETIRPKYASRDEARRAFGLALDCPVVVLAPGSRRNEIAHLAPVLAGAARLLAAQRPDLQFVVPLAPTVDDGEVRAIFAAAGVAPAYTRGEYYDTVACADAGIVTSGTATLEAALAGLPHVIVYRGNVLNYAIARRVVQVDKIGLPNIILGRVAFRELIQKECTPEAAAAQALALLAGPAREAALAACAEVRRALSGGEVSRQTAAALQALIRRRPPATDAK